MLQPRAAGGQWMKESNSSEHLFPNRITSLDMVGASGGCILYTWTILTITMSQCIHKAGQMGDVALYCA
jgi:hypothetical protein